MGSFALTPDGKTLAVMGVDGQPIVGLYDTATGKERRRLTIAMQDANAAGGGALNVVFAATPMMLFSPDGRTLAVPISHNAIGLWDTATGKELPQVRAAEEQAIQGVVFSPDGASLALDLGNEQLTLWEIATGKERRKYGKKPEGQAGQGDPVAARIAVGGGLGFGGGMAFGYMRSSTPAAFSPDGRLLAQGRAGGAISIWETGSGKELGQLKGHRGDVATLAFAPDGKALASGSADTTGLIWDVSGPAKRRTLVADLPERDVDARWADLAAGDAAKAFDAVAALAAAPRQTVPFLKTHLKHAPVPDAERITKLIAELDSDAFATRQKASAELEKVGEAAMPLLEKTLAEKEPSPEVRKRLEDLIAKASGKTPTGDALRQRRAIEILERIGTPEARQVLQTLAKEGSGTTSRLAQVALDRLGK
jgi:hypothetical protein